MPTIGCQCAVCQSSDPHDKRLRCSALIENEDTRLLIDCGPDFRQQIMHLPFRRIDGILITHAHYDHMGGMDDIRPYCQFGEINVYADPIARNGLLQMLPYCFEEHRYPGVPAIQLNEIHKHEVLRIGSIEVMPFEVMHHDLPILGFRIGSLAYITDMKTIDEDEMKYVEGCKTLVVNALRQKPHHSHQTVDEAVRFSQRIAPRHTYLIHASHDIGLHAELSRQLPTGIEMAYDGLSVSV